MAVDKAYLVRIQTQRQLRRIFHRDSGERLAWCFIGDDESVEKIADILSSKYLGAAAMELRAPRVLSLLSELRPGE